MGEPCRLPHRQRVQATNPDKWEREMTGSVITVGALSYCSSTGIFTWTKARFGVRVGSRAGTRTRWGYRQVMFEGKPVLEHRLAWLFVNGVAPPGHLDHINGIKDDNRISNLRLATSAENSWNRGACKHSKTGIKGVFWCPIRKKFQAQIRVNGKRICLGRFTTAEEAAFAYASASAEHHGEFSRLETSNER